MAASGSDSTNGSKVAQAEAFFAAEDSRFVEALRQVHDSNWLAHFANRWRDDSRRWAREQMLLYLAASPNSAGHQPVIKRLFKQAEENGDDQLLAIFAPLFDRLVRHERKTRWQFDEPSQANWKEEYLVASAPKLSQGVAQRPGHSPQPSRSGEAVYFSYATRYYLQRRVWRYFRHLGYRDGQRYVRAVVQLLANYEDEPLSRGEHLLDSWTLMQTAFRQSEVLNFGRERIAVAEGHQLSELRAAPPFPEHWQSDDAFAQLLDLLEQAPSRLVRVWAIQLLEQTAASRLAKLPLERLFALLVSGDDDQEQFSQRLLQQNKQLDRVALETWLGLLDQASLRAVEVIASAMRQHLPIASVPVETALDLALHASASVAQLGFDWLQQLTPEASQLLDPLDLLADPPCPVLAGAIAAWALERLGSEPYHRDRVLPFFDSPSPAVRHQAWAWLELKNCPGRDDPVLFCRLMETPYHDLRLRLVDLLEQRSLPGEAKEGLVSVWASVLLGVEQGGRQKLKATRQVAHAIACDLALADTLLPVLAVAVRSSRQPESRAGLAAVMTLLESAPSLAPAVAHHLPELEVVAVPQEFAAEFASGGGTMNLQLKYIGQSGLVGSGSSRSLRLAPNLTRDPVAFDAALRQPLRFREAISALHHIVVSDWRSVPRDRTAYEAWKQAKQQRESAKQQQEFQRLKREILAHPSIVPADFEKEYQEKRRRYWKLRSQYSRRLQQGNPRLWRMLTPCDPVITVADDIVFFECFSADQASYGCLTLDRNEGFTASSEVQLGTTNVDYSWALYDHFQTLRTYRPTRLRVDPSGLDVSTGTTDYREEKIDLPEGWLRGFMQVQSAMTLPMRRVTLSRDALYSIIAWYQRHKARKSPRAMRFELTEGKPPVVVLEPWEQRIESHSTRYHGPSDSSSSDSNSDNNEAIRLWGVRRLLALSRVLPLVESCDVYLLGSGLPSFWVVKLGEMRLTLGLSGWTANDWSQGSALDLLAPPGEPSSHRLEAASSLLQRQGAMRLDRLQALLACGTGVCSTGDTVSTLHRLAHQGQVIYDLAAGVYRWRQIMPRAVGEAELGPEPAELVASREIVQNGTVQIVSQTELSSSEITYAGTSAGQAVEITVDQEGVTRRGQCVCSHHHQSGLRQGPCRHLLALRSVALGHSSTSNDSMNTSAATLSTATVSTAMWYNRLQKWAMN